MYSVHSTVSSKALIPAGGYYKGLTGDSVKWKLLGALYTHTCRNACF